MSVQYGSDTYCITDIPLVDVQVTDPVQLIGQRIARRLQTPRGALAAIGGDASVGWDVRQYLNGKMSPAMLAQAAQQIKSECEKDEEVQTADVSLSFVNGGALTISIHITAATGPFDLVLDVSQVSFAAVIS